MWWIALAVLGSALLLSRVLMAQLYDVLIVKMTAVWYKCVLDRIQPDQSLLDVGIGTATALARNAALLRHKKLRVVGVDYEASYVRRAHAILRDAGVADSVAVHCRSVYDDLRDLRIGGRLFDAGYFSGSISLMPDPAAALRAVAGLVAPGGPIYITQTFQDVRSPLMELVKPLLRFLTTVDFGVVTYHSDVLELIREAGLVLVEDAPIPGSINNGMQTARLIVVRSP